MNAWRPSVLGSRPGVHPPLAMSTLSAPSPAPDAAFYARTPGSLPAGLYSALNGMSINTSGGGNDWFLDTGATAHMASNPGILTSPPSTVNHHIVVGNGQFLPAHGTGNASVPTSSSPLHLRNILIAPKLVKNLILVRAVIIPFLLNLILGASPSRTFAPGRHCSDVIRLGNYILFARPPPQQHRLRLHSLHLWTATSGMHASATQVMQRCSDCPVPLGSPVPSLVGTLVMLVVVANMYGCPLVSPIKFLHFLFSFCIVMYGPHP